MALLTLKTRLCSGLLLIGASTLWVSAPVHAQGQMEEENGDESEITIEVDRARSKNEGKSLGLALLLSAAVPGAGEYYLQEKKISKVFLLAETGFWASLYVAVVAKKSYLQSARNYASTYAGIDASAKDEDFLELMANYRSYQEKHHRQDSYELVQVLSGKKKEEYGYAPVEANFWDFGSSNTPENTEHWRTYQGTLRYYRSAKVAVSFALGALALNRLASVLNTLQLHKTTSVNRLGFHFIPEFGEGYGTAVLTLKF